MSETPIALVPANLTENQQIAYESCVEQGENVFITGSGGVGKSFLIKRIVKGLEANGKRVQVCGTTGCASVLLNCNARTLHSWSGIGATNVSNDIICTRIKMNKHRRKNWINIDTLIIDEVSMLSKGMFELLDQIAKEVRMTQYQYKLTAGKPFGGIQIIACGDFYQLPPVPTQGDPDSEKMCFESPLWNDTYDVQIVLDKVFRQKNNTYLKILNEIREGHISKFGVDTLKKYIRQQKDGEKQPVTLFSTKKQANEYNQKRMNALPGKVYTMKSKTSYEPIMCDPCEYKHRSLLKACTK
jgi:ATP-dependent DNA helicase PIF1